MVLGGKPLKASAEPAPHLNQSQKVDHAETRTDGGADQNETAASARSREQERPANPAQEIDESDRAQSRAQQRQVLDNPGARQGVG